MNNQKHYGAAILAFVIWGFFPLALRALQGYSAGEILYYRIFASTIVLAFVIFTFKRKDARQQLIKFRALEISERKKFIWLVLGGGALLTINWLTFIYIVNFVNVKTASFAYLICPVITAVLGYVLIKERLTVVQWIAVGLCALSCAAMGFNSGKELGFSFLTAFTYALYLVSQRKLQGFDRIIILGVQILFSFLLLNITFVKLVDEVPTSQRFYLVILIIAVVFTVIPLFLNLFALNKIKSATIGILMYLNPIFNFTIAFVVFDETINQLQVIGYGIILIALVLFNYHHFKRLQPADPTKA